MKIDPQKFQIFSTIPSEWQLASWQINCLELALMAVKANPTERGI
jgi:hypothetical protein